MADDPARGRIGVLRRAAGLGRHAAALAGTGDHLRGELTGGAVVGDQRGGRRCRRRRLPDRFVALPRPRGARDGTRRRVGADRRRPQRSVRRRLQRGGLHATGCAAHARAGRVRRSGCGRLGQRVGQLGGPHLGVAARIPDRIRPQLRVVDVGRSGAGRRRDPGGATVVTTFPWLSVLWLLPLVGAVVIILVPAGGRQFAKWLGVVVSVAVLALSLALAVGFKAGGPTYQFVESHPWIPAFGAGYTLGIDGIALVLVLLTTVLVPFLLVAGWNDGGERSRGTQAYVALTLTIESMVLVSVVSLDVLLFYVFFEAMLIPMYFLIGGFGGGAHRSRAAVKFLLYNLFGGLIMLAAVIGLYVVTAESGSGTFDFRQIVAAVTSGTLGGSSGVMKALFLGFMFAFAIKAPLWPFHRWLPDAAVESTPATAVLITAVMDKVGTFGMLRYCLQLFPDASTYFRPLIIVLAVIGVIYGAIVAIGQTDIMRLIAYTSISHFGFIILGIFVMTSQGQSGSTLYMLNHGISTAAVFLIAGFLISRRGTRSIADYGGVQKVAPILAGTFLVSSMATLSLPGLAPFVSEFLVLLGTFNRYWLAAAIGSTALVLAAIYMLWLYQRVMTGPVAEGNERITDLRARELIVVAPLMALLFVLGVYPKPVLDIINPAVDHTMITIGQHDPAPSVTHPVLGATPGTAEGPHQ